MKSKIRQMQVAIDEADRQEKQAARELSAGNQLLVQQKSYLQSLYDYQKEYQAKLHEPKTVRQANLIREYQGFLKNLENMIHTQSFNVKNTEYQVSQLRDQWTTKSTKLKALEQVLKDYHAAIQKRLDDNEQSESEENTIRSLYLSDEDT